MVVVSQESEEERCCCREEQATHGAQDCEDREERPLPEKVALFEAQLLHDIFLLLCKVLQFLLIHFVSLT